MSFHEQQSGLQLYDFWWRISEARQTALPGDTIPCQTLCNRRTATFVFERICYGLTLFNPEQTKDIQVLILSTVGCFKAFSWKPDLRNSYMSNAHFAPSLGCHLSLRPLGDKQSYPPVSYDLVAQTSLCKHIYGYRYFIGAEPFHIAKDHARVRVHGTSEAYPVSWDEI
ncbi:unnamed protein product [Fusarium graminearum]|nr:unnamed protein product [Fusarium graminearum]